MGSSIHKKKGYLLIEVVMGFALISILSVSIFSAFNTSLRIENEASSEYESYSMMSAIKKECLKNISIDKFTTDGTFLVKDFIEAESLLAEKFDLSDVFIQVFVADEKGNIDIKIFDEEDALEFRRNICVDIS